MTILWPESLKDAIARRRAVIVIGSGASANSATDDGDRPPTWGIFLKDAYNNLPRKKTYIKRALDRYEYLEACGYLKDEYGNEWDRLVRRVFMTPNYRPAEIHRAIFNLDCRVILSLNFDRIYEKYAHTQSEGTVIVKNYHDDDIRQVVAGSGRYILKPHGSVETINNIIFTAEDYASARVEHAKFYEMITALLHTHTFLFVGCGLSDPDMRLILEDYRYKHSEFPHYITLPAPVADAEVSLIRRSRGLNVLKYSKKDNHSELTRSLLELGAEMLDRRLTIAREQDW
ncbi:SIR2 family protein [Salinarimonas sp.]|uniref:SIR2 family NAD-dependent protein deacylase n=1 Tax=Salinarimonas sp. TaxID=2766526 RepID=UPI0032D8CDDF